jgi:hypothetical protein
MPAFGGSASDSDFSLASVDTNPTFDQFDDGGSSFDFSSILNTGMQMGTEIAGLISQSQGTPAYAQALPYPSSALGLPKPASSSKNAQLVLVVVLALGAAWVFMGMKST